MTDKEEILAAIAATNAAITGEMRKNHADVMGLLDTIALGAGRIEAELGTVKADVGELKTTVDRIDKKFDRLETRVEALESRP